MSESEKNVPGKCWGCSTSPQLKLYQTFIFATPILFTLVLLLLFCLLYVRRRRSARAVSLRRPQFFARGLFSAPLEHGLNKSFRDNLPTIVYDDTFGDTRDDNQCAVCLSDYVLNEKLQQLPICGHVFHLECIDEWLASNSTCPICRSSLLPHGKVVPFESPVHDSDVHTNSGRENSADHQQHVPLAESSIGEIETSGTPKSHRSVSSMEDVVKESVEHIINIER